ncbi:MAG: AbrB/MazE/SpoVT family DNA-binding domain-containing protein [Acidobacteria bacterium]|nr:AbrB/MazE/SpoVT family DNA-binding domain-containing protein [Acidobacteriota bacterium]MCW5971681.1 AbrB/MazE/SpoVT family DNA-binding domain-containing protein [Blastocatellales bacterium]
MATETAMPIEFLATTRLGEKGQLTVPKEYRDALGLESGAVVAVLRLGNGLLLIPEQDRFRLLCERIAGIFAGHGVTGSELLESLPASRRRVFERHYPELVRTGKTRTSQSKKKNPA